MYHKHCLLNVKAFLCSLIQDMTSTSRGDFLKIAGGAAVAAVMTPLPVMAELVVPAQSTEYTFPTDWGLTFRYEEDAAKVRAHMVVATGMAKGSDKMEDFGKNMKKEMVDFVSYYRRFPKVAGKPSFSTLYTSINVLAGHYTSYGYKYPLPEKRRKRLYQEYAEIDKSLKRGR
jgi:photosystem II Psb27 protein